MIKRSFLKELVGLTSAAANEAVRAIGYKYRPTEHENVPHLYVERCVIACERNGKVVFADAADPEEVEE